MAQAKRKKRFFDVEIPIINKETHLQGYEIKDLDGRIINYDLTRILKGKSSLLKLKVIVENDKIRTIPTQFKLLPSFLKRMVRKGTNYVEDSFSTPAKDVSVKIKPFLITRRKVSRKVRKALREKTKEELTKYIKSNNSEAIFEDILKNQLQRTLSQTLKKIYPLSLCEIRIFKIEEKQE